MSRPQLRLGALFASPPADQFSICGSIVPPPPDSRPLTAKSPPLRGLTRATSSALEGWAKGAGDGPQ